MSCVGGEDVLSKYLDEAMKRAEYEITEESMFWGHIPGFQGVWAHESTLEAYRIELRSVLEDWILLKLWDNDSDIPVLGKLNLVPGKKPLKRTKHGSSLKTPAHKTTEAARV
jgi:predicted RNase H-like HicB family nuclease